MRTPYTWRRSIKSKAAANIGEKAHNVSFVWIHCNASEEGEKIEGRRRRSRSERKSLAEC